MRHVNVKMHNFNLWIDPVTKAEDWDCIGLYLKTGAHAYSAFKLKAASVQHHIQINGSHYPLLTYFNGKSRRAPEKIKARAENRWTRYQQSQQVEADSAGHSAASSAGLMPPPLPPPRPPESTTTLRSGSASTATTTAKSASASGVRLCQLRVIRLPFIMVRRSSFITTALRSGRASTTTTTAKSASACGVRLCELRVRRLPFFMVRWCQVRHATRLCQDWHGVSR